MADPKYSIGQKVSFAEFKEGTRTQGRTYLDWFGKGRIVAMEEEDGAILYTLVLSEVYEEADDDGNGIDNFAEDIIDYFVYESEITGLIE